ncbi:AAA family ATPase [Psychrobacillus sp. MER TA 171]|uniref:ATP-dependent nuclease n=1 Tax=Psychrobacillus sp. MER TA 171 TaxID=2939577 RepID=UPI00203BC030|nr:AAA family ATPase [Psychrobacillus sp. MER TA 171]MCM3358027.1 AAA family ATPase [Psychrobacillus sp. MER TA 171]
MYIAELSIENFRTFNSRTTIEFHEGTNVIIGQNNAGKTTVIKALQLLFDNQQNKRLSVDDFNRTITTAELKKAPPKIIISAKLVESLVEPEYSDHLVTVSTWLTKIESPYEARITYEFFLPDKEVDSYVKTMSSIDENQTEEYWNTIRNIFLRKYTQKIYIGNPEQKNLIDQENINKFAFQFLTAIRDVERDLFTGRNTLLKEVIDFFMDYEIKIDENLNKDEKIQQIKAKKKAFSTDAQLLITSLQARMSEGNIHMLKYVEDTGAGIGGMKPSFDGTILDTELYSALKLSIESETGIKLPAIHNGLGYNNLIYISLLLAKMQKDASGDYLGSNAKVYSILAIEEPEAHLHPNMQYKFLKFLKENQSSQVNQIFITSHSPNITAAVELDDIIVLQKEQENIHVAYPGRVFTDSTEDQKSKNYVKRFIDVTKADMFFAHSLILVEGLAELLLVPEFAKKMGIDLVDTHTSIINIGGRYFDHFLKLFNQEKSEYAIKKKIACITDLDPVRKERKKGASWVACSPLFLDAAPNNYEYKSYSNTLIDKRKNNKHDLIEVFSQKENESSTFEYDLLLKNITTESLLTESVSNKEEIKRLMSAFNDGKSIQTITDILSNNNYGKEVREYVSSAKIDEPKTVEKIKAKIIAGRYLNSIKKGEVAQELAYIVATSNKDKISPPDYIKEAITWISQKQ